MPGRPDAVGEKRPDFNLPSSLGMMVSELSATTSAIRSVMKDSSMIAERTARFYADAQESNRTMVAVQKQFLDQFASMAQGYVGQQPGGLPGGGGGVVGPSMLPSYHGSSEAPPMPVETPRDYSGPPGIAPERTRTSHSPFAGPGGKEDNSAYFNRMRRYDVGAARSDASLWAADRIGGWAERELPSYAGPTSSTNAAGETIWKTAEGDLITNPHGVYLAEQEAGAYAARAATATGRLAALGKTVQEKGLGKGLASAAPAGAMKVAGTAAAVYTMADQVKDFAIQQRQANLGWQQTLGGSNFEGFGERAQSQLFEMQSSWFGGMGAGTASKLYSGAAGIYGRDRSLRDQAMDFGTNMYSRHGMSVEDSLALVRAAADSGNDSLSGLADSIKSVGETARAAGINAADAQKMFASTYEDLSSRGIGGSANAAGISAVATNLATSMGRRFSGDLNLGGIYSDPNLRIMANRANKSLGDMVADWNGPGGVNMAAAAGADLSQWRSEQVISDSQMAGINSRKQRLLGDGMGEEAVLESLGTDLIRQIDPQRLLAMAREIGYTGADALEASMFLIETRDGSAAEKTRQESEKFTRDRLQGDVDINTSNREAFVEGRRLKEVGRSTSSFRGRERDILLYNEWVDQTGKDNKVVERLLKDGDYDPGRRYLVKTKDGEKQYTLGEIIQNDQLDQLYRGDTLITEGAGEGQRIGDFFEDLGVLSAVEADGAASINGSSANRVGEHGGKSIDRDDVGAGVTGRVLIELKPGLDTWLTANATGAAVLGPSGGNPAPGFVTGS